MGAENGGGKQNGVDAAKSEEELPEKKQAPDPRDVIVITGRAENCEKAKQALLVRKMLGNLSPQPQGKG